MQKCACTSGLSLLFLVTALALTVIVVSLLGLLTFITKRIDWTIFDNMSTWRTRVRMAPTQCQFLRSPFVLFAFRLLCFLTSLSVCGYEWFQDIARAFHYYTVWNFHIVLLYFGIGAWSSFRAWRHTRRHKFTENLYRIVEPPTDPKDRYTWLDRFHNILLEIELPATVLICIIVWTILFEAEAKIYGVEAARHKFLSWTSLIQHAMNVVMMWTDFAINGMVVHFSHGLLLLAWMGLYAFFHSCLWFSFPSFCAYPFMDLATPQFSSGSSALALGTCPFTMSHFWPLAAKSIGSVFPCEGTMHG